MTSVLSLSQDDRDTVFRRFGDVYRAREIHAGGRVLPLVRKPRDLCSLHYGLDGSGHAMSDFLQMRALRGLLAWHDGHVVLEHYAPGHDESTRWASFSIAKSVTSMLIGAAIEDGCIESVEQPLTHYLPQLRGTCYEAVSIGHLLQMTSGVQWNEDYADPASDVSKAGDANGAALLRYLAACGRAAAPGMVFNYNTGETNLVGEVLRAAIGTNAATYLSRRIWQPFGMERDASWLIAGPGGDETAGCCISATLRDYARIGIFALRNGRLADGTQVLPGDWMRESTTPSTACEGYGYLWWLDEAGTFRARGIFGQQIFIDPRANTVIAVHSNAPAAVDTDYHGHLEALVPTLASAVAQ